MPPESHQTVLLDQLAALIGPRQVLSSPGQMAPYLRDERNLYQGSALAVLTPGSAAEVAAVLSHCYLAGTAVVPQGGNTGYCGGATPDDTGSQIVLSLERLNRVIEVDVTGACMSVEAGVTLAQAQDAAAAAGLLLPLAMGSQASCQIGGNISTNAGGLAVLRYGTARDLVLGLEAILPDGRLISDMTGLRKDNTGYDLKQLFVGAEGTLGVVTAACLKLFPQPARYQTSVLALNRLAAATDVLARVRQALGDNLTSCEYLSGAAVAMACGAIGTVRAPLTPEPEHSLLLEWGEFGPPNGGRDAEAVFGELLDAGLIDDVVIAVNESQRQDFWRLRESIPAAEKVLGGSLKHDISVRLGQLADYIEQTRQALLAQWPGLRLSIYGHIGDGNVHLNILPPPHLSAPDYFAEHGARLSQLVHDMAHERGGSFSAEHGVGVYKRDLLAHYADDARLELMRALKRTLDPRGLMNPGKLL